MPFKHIRRAMTALGLTLCLLFSLPVRAEPGKEFIMSCSYGVLAGTIVGAATLAFTDKPGDNLNKIARGASLGLYAGILLGFYVAYGVSDDDEPADEGETPPEGALPPTTLHHPQPSLLVFPLITEQGFEGAGFNWTVKTF